MRNNLAPAAAGGGAESRGTGIHTAVGGTRWAAWGMTTKRRRRTTARPVIGARGGAGSGGGGAKGGGGWVVEGMLLIKTRGYPLPGGVSGRTHPTPTSPGGYRVWGWGKEGRKLGEWDQRGGGGDSLRMRREGGIISC